MNTLTSEDMRSRLLAAKLPSPPQTLFKLMQLCQNEDADLSELAALIALDPALTAKVLSVAHSAAYHSADAGNLTLLQASNRLGTELIKVLVIAEMVTQTFRTLAATGSTDLRHFWRHSLSVALIAKELAPHLDFMAAEQAYLAGLLHDIGRLALLVAAPEASQALFAEPDDAALLLKEQHHLGMSHTEAAGWLLKRWYLSDVLIRSVLQHHEQDPVATECLTLTRLIQLAHLLAEVPLEQTDLADDLVRAAQMPAADLLAVLQRAQQKVAQTARDLGIDISATALPVKPSGDELPQTDAALQAQMAQKLFDRSVLNEMAMNLIGRRSNESALRHLRRYASALLQLENSVVMVLRSNQQQLVPVSMSERHQSAVKLSYDLSKDVAFEQCVTGRKVVFSGRSSRGAIALLNVLDADELVLIPLISARQCIGILAAAMPADLSAHIRSQLPMLQAFGTYAGLALAKRRQTTMDPQTLEVISRQEQRQGLRKLIREITTRIEPATSVDLCQAVREVVQQLHDGRLIPGNIKIHCQLEDRVTLVRCSVGTIKLVTLALIGSAFERMNREGDIVIVAGGMAYRNGAMFTALTLSDATASSGQVISAQLQEHACITAGNDVRLVGLAEVNQLVEKMAGHLSFKAGASGTRFDILLPCAKHLQLVA
jgi:putative nucleotidyltransferase with HDIG domain